MTCHAKTKKILEDMGFTITNAIKLSAAGYLETVELLLQPDGTMTLTGI